METKLKVYCVYVKRIILVVVCGLWYGSGHLGSVHC